MTETVEVVAARPLTLPAGCIEKDELVPVTTAHAEILASMEMLKLADGKGTPAERAIAAGRQARKDLDERMGKEAKDAAEAEARAAKATKTTEKEA